MKNDEKQVMSEITTKALRVCGEHSTGRGTVYFVECGGFVKIGYTESQSAKGILEAFDAGLPFDQQVLGFINGGHSLKASLHELFREQHHRGEWFYLSGALKDFIEALRGHPIRRVCGRRRGKPVLDHADFERLSVFSAVNEDAA